MTTTRPPPMRLMWTLAVVAILAASCADDVGAPASTTTETGEEMEEVRGACDIREKEPSTDSSESDSVARPIDALFSRNATFARLVLDFEERVRGGASSDFLVFTAVLDEVLLPSVKDVAVPETFRILTLVDADVCPDERFFAPGASVIATIDEFTFIAKPDVEWWLATAWIEDESADYVSPIQPSPALLADLYEAYERADLPPATRTEMQLAWALERREFQLPRGAEERSLYGPIELALGEHHQQLSEIHIEVGECGTLFALVDEERRAALIVSPANPELRRSGELPMTSPAVGGAWELQVVLGTDLLEGWCGDSVIDDPSSQTDHLWPVSAGKVEFIGPTNSVAVVRITGLIVAPPSALPYEFPDLEIRHDCWLCEVG